MTRVLRSSIFIAISVLSLSVIVAGRTYGELVTYGTAPERYDRFYQPASGSDPAKAFIGNGFDWSGIGRVVDGSSVYSWGTMISDTYYVSAAHNRPANGAQLTFYQGNDLTGSPTLWTATVADGDVFQTGYSAEAGPDLVIGQLTACVPSWVKKYPLIQRMEGTNYTAYLDPTIYLVGANGPDPNSTFNMKVGKNAIDRPSGLGIDRPYNTDGTGLGADEAWTNTGDSGGPSFAVVGTNNLVLAGIHTNPYRDQSISANLDSIRTFFAPTSEHVSVATDLLGDLNGDYQVSFADYSILIGNYNHAGIYRYNQGDLNGDGAVDFADYSALIGTYGQSKFSPADFNQDLFVDKTDMMEIGSHWHATGVTAFTNGDANGDTNVDGHDIEEFNKNRVADRWVLPTISNPELGDITDPFHSLVPDGIIDALDVDALNGKINGPTYCSPANAWCDRADIDMNHYVQYHDYTLLLDKRGNYIPADINGDLKVDTDDLSIMMDPTHWGQSTYNGKSDGDLNGDHTVDIHDFEIMADWWGRQSMAGMPNMTTIPEPGSFVLLLGMSISSVGFMRRRYSYRL